MVVQKVIDKIKFSMFSPEMIRKMSAAKITIPDTYDDDGYPIDGGLVDMRLGVVDPGLRCKTCGGRIRECPGHFGHIDLVRPVVHVEFAKHILYVLRSTCPKCHRIVTKPVEEMKKIEKEEEEEKKIEEKKKMEKEKESEEKVFTLFEEDEEQDKKKMTTKEMEKELKKRDKGKKKCPHCGAELPTITLLKPTSFYKNKQLMLPNEIREWLSAIPDDDIRELGFDPLYARPEWMILTVLPVPPVNVRPSINLESGERSEDDLTHKLVDIIRINQKLEANINAGAPQLIIEDLWELLQYHVTTYFDNETANIPPARHRSGRPLKTLAQRLKGKEGRFRYNLSGKRVDFSARTVISPDPNIRIDEVGVPQDIAEEVTVPVRVTDWNIKECKKYILSKEYPKAVYVIRSDGRRIKVTDFTREDLANELKVGWTIERQLVDGDITIFNRQPSLHRISMMGHEVRVLPGKTFRLNPATTTPYNADFDGDEMNLHIMQTEEAQAEAKFLMKVEDQIISPRHGHAIIKPIEDHISGLFFLTRDEASFSKEEASKILYFIGITEMPKPDLKNERYSGKLLFSQILPDSLNLRTKTKQGKDVVIKGGKLIKGYVDGRVIEEIIEAIFVHEGSLATRTFLDRMTRMVLEVLSTSGLTVSLRNYRLSEKAEKELNELISKMNREIENLIFQYKNKTLERAPGMTLKETLENSIIAVTSRTRNEAGKIVEKDLGDENPSIIMARIGARGSLLNAIQMSAMVAQQVVRNKRPKRGYKKRVLTFFKPGKLTGRERGFVYSCFRKGLYPDEFFLHSMGGREALVNTAIRTARSGYMQRRLINALQDLVVYPDKTVRNADMSIVQTVYGGDGKDPMLASTEKIVDTVKQDDVDTA